MLYRGSFRPADNPHHGPAFQANTARLHAFEHCFSDAPELAEHRSANVIRVTLRPKERATNINLQRNFERREKSFLLEMQELCNDVKSAKWNVSGARIGSTAAAVKKLFGNKAAKEVDSTTKLLTWYYGMDANINPGSTNFAFRNGKVVSITSVWLMC